MKTNTKTTLKIYAQAVAKYPVVTGLVFIGVVAAQLLEIVNPIFFKKFFDTMSDASNLALVKKELVGILLIILIVRLGSWIFWRIATFASNFLESQVITDLSNFCFSVLHRHSFSFFTNNFVGSLTKKVSRFTRSFESVADRLFWDFLPLCVAVSGILFVLFRRNFWIGLILAVWLFLFLVINYIFIRYKLKYDIQKSEVDSRVTGLLADTITNNVNIKLFNGLAREKKSFFDLNEIQRKLRKFIWDISGAFQAAQALLIIALEIGIFYFAIDLRQKNILTLGDFVLLQAYLGQIFSQIWHFNHIVQKLYEDLAEADEMTEVVIATPEILDKGGAENLKVGEGKIEFKNVVFKYGSGKTILDNFTLSVSSHERLALVGPSGAGKTTVIKLLLRMHDVTAGKIFADKQNVAEVTQESLWQNISLVPQDPLLFHRTLKENIRYGKPDATDEEVYAAAKLSHCDEFIKELTHGYDTYVGERGIKLSGGERQRVAIARAILRNAPILVLDEATSSLDSESERLIQDALNTLMKNKTVIVIAHRLSTIMKMDRIVVIAKGGIAEAGTHGELLTKTGGLYKRLWEMQAGGFIR